MLKNYKLLAASLVAGFPLCLWAQLTPVQQTYTYPKNAPAPVFPVPSERQMAWQETEFYAFFHYGMNTFRNNQNGGDNEWGYGNEPETDYAPTELPDCRQWIKAVKAAGMKGGIAVVKHHDGFCLWPTATTTHSVSRSGGVGPTVNVPDLFSKACEQEGMKYGFYVSPWDRNSASYAKPEYVKDVFLKQVSELAKYGSDQFEMWFDGANGGDGYYGGANETRSIDAATYYDMPNLADSVHKLQPNCVIWGGFEARWVGNEAGYAPITNWAATTEDGWKWCAAEADTKATNQGWFWNDGETPYTPERLYRMYLETVGRNATFILNVPPNKAGVLPDASVSALKGMGDLIKARLTADLATAATVSASASRANFGAANLTDGDKNSYWATDDGQNTATLTLTWSTPQTAHYVMLQEFIRKGQRVKAFSIETSADGITFTPRATDQCTTIGYKRIVPLNGSTSDYGTGFPVKAIRISITDSKACPLLHTVSVF